MKVLWFVNMMPKEFAVLMGREGTNYQGWIAGLCEAIRRHARNVDLTIACMGPRGWRAEANGVQYISIENITVQDVSACVREINPDIIQLHGSEGAYPALPKQTWCGKPVCMSLQGIINGYAQHYLGNLTEKELSPYLTFMRRLHLGFSEARVAEYWRTVMSESEKVAFSHVREVFGRTRWDYAWSRYLNPNVRYHEVGEVLRTPFYQGMRRNEDVVRHTIFCGASMTAPLKGGHWLLKAIASLKNRYPDIRLRVANARNVERPHSFLGRMRWKQYHRYLYALIEALHLRNNVDLLPSLSAEEVVQELRSAEVFCLPSLIENSPNSLGEALLIGTPAVVTDVGGNSTIMRADEEGIFVPAADPAELALAIEKCFEDPESARLRACCGYERACKTYDPQRVVEQLESVYREILGDGQLPHSDLLGERG